MREWILRLKEQIFSADMLGLVLVLAALLFFTQGLAASLPEADTTYFLITCLSAAVLSLRLAIRNLRPYQAAAALAAVGVAGVWIIGARLTLPLVHLIGSLIEVIPHIIPALQSKTALDTGPIRESWSVIGQASTILALRFQAWFISFDGKVRLNDGLLQNMIWLLILWLIAGWMGWFTARRNATVALLPAVLLLAFVASYSGLGFAMLSGLVLVMLVLMGLWHYRNHMHEWESLQMGYSESILFDSTVAALLLAGLISLLAFITPSVSWQQIRDHFRARDQNPLADALGLQAEPPRVINLPLPKPDLPREHLLGGGFATSEELVMTIRTGELPPSLAPPSAIQAPRYYWRSVVYDEYMRTGWVTSRAPSHSYQADTPLIPGLLRGYKPLHLEIQLAQPEAKLYWSGMLFSANIPLTARWRVKPPSSLFADQSALLQADLFAASTTGGSATHFTARVYVPDVTIAALRAASTDYYPDSIRGRYLQLPQDLPTRVQSLARHITADKANAYDKAKAIETYLRTSYPYDLDIPAPPADRDVTDYFLFDLKKGYCDYYATAMVVLARASGIPARFVSGYAPGIYDPVSAQYIVQERHAHSWAEVYFPEIGWVEFEPTASEPEIVRALDQSRTSPARQNAPATEELYRRLLRRFRLKQLGYVLFPLALLLTSIVIYFALVEPWWYLRRRQPPSIAIERIFRKLYRASRPWLGQRIGSETALEFAGRMIEKLQHQYSNSRLKRFYAKTPAEILHLTDLYYTGLFRNNALEQKDLHAAWNAWCHIRWRVWFARIKPSRRPVLPKEHRDDVRRSRRI